MGHKTRMPMRYLILTAAMSLAACGSAREDAVSRATPLYPGETAELREMINATADTHDVPGASCTG